MLTEKQAKQLYDAGRKAKADGESLQRAICDLGGSWSECKAFEMGYIGQRWEVKQYERYGNVPDGPSYNFADSKPERGVSVVTDEWRETIHGIFFVAKNGSRKIVKFNGVFVGHYGGDGEPLVLPVK